MDGRCRLRPATSADLEALAQLERTAFSDPWTLPQLQEAFGWGGAVAFVAEADDGAIDGYVLGRVVVDEAEVLTIATHPTRRRGGIGRALLAAAMTAMVQRGAVAVWLEVRVSNEAAIAMYRKAGFVAAGVRRGYYRRPVEDALVLRHELAHPASAGPLLQ